MLVVGYDEFVNLYDNDNIVLIIEAKKKNTSKNQLFSKIKCINLEPYENSDS